MKVVVWILITFLFYFPISFHYFGQLKNNIRDKTEAMTTEILWKAMESEAENGHHLRYHFSLLKNKNIPPFLET